MRPRARQRRSRGDAVARALSGSNAVQDSPRLTGTTAWARSLPTPRRSLAPEISVAYFNELTAPSKRLVWFETSGREPFVDQPAKFNVSMVELVRPVVA